MTGTNLKPILKKTAVAVIVAALALAGVVPSFAAKSDGDAFCGTLDIHSEDAPELSGTSAILMDASTGVVLYEKNSKEKRDPASVTKILNALVVLDVMNLDDEVTAPEYNYEKVGNHMNVKPGEVFTIEQLLNGMLVESNNDAAEALALVTGGDIETFCKMMNERAASCGATDTNFTNPNGLNNLGQENHRTTAYDLAKITKEAMSNQDFRKIVGSTSYTIPKTNKSGERKLHSTNALLYNTKIKIGNNDEKVNLYYEGCNGVKTGLTSVAGECFVGSAKRGNTELIAVTLNAATTVEKFEDVSKLFDYGFANFETYTVAAGDEVLGQIPVKRGALKEVEYGTLRDFNITISKDFNAQEGIELKTELDVKKVTAPVKIGDEFGEVTAFDADGNAVAKAKIYALEKSEKGGILSYVGIADEELPWFFVILSAVVIAIIILILTRKLRRQRRRNRRRAARARNIESMKRELERDPFNEKIIKQLQSSDGNMTYQGGRSTIQGGRGSRRDDWKK